MRRTSLVLIVLALVIGVTVWSLSGGGRPVIGFAYTQPSAPYLVLARAALAERGIPSPLFMFDSAAVTETSDDAIALATRFAARPDIVIVVGPSNSRHALATAPGYNAAGLPHLIPSATSRRLRNAGAATFTLAPDDSIEGEFLARFAWQDLRARKALLVYINDEYGEGLRAGVVSSFVAQGGEVLESVPLGSEMDVPTLMTATLRRHHPDVIFAAARSYETGLILRAIHDARSLLPVVAGDGAYLPAQLERASGGDLTGLFVLAFWVYDSTDPAHRAFAERVRRILGAEPTPEDALTEDALVLATAARRAAGPDRAAVRRWLAGLGHDRPPFRGITGSISFGPERELPLTMVRFRDGRAERVDRSLVAPPPSP